MELKTPTTVKLTHINVRSEKHGEDDVDAYDLDFALEGSNADVLGMLAPGLCESVYWRAGATDAQADVPGVLKILPNLRFPELGALPWTRKTEGADLTMEYGTARKESNIHLTTGSSATKRVELKEGGTTVLFFQFSTANMPDGVLDKLRKKLKQQVTITVVQSETARKAPKEQTEMDVGTGDKPAPARKPGAAERAAVAKNGKGPEDGDGEGNTPDATSTFAAAHGKGDDAALPVKNGATLSPEAAWPFPTGRKADTEKPPQSVTTEVVIETSRPGTRTARGRDKTKAALAAGSKAAGVQ